MIQIYLLILQVLTGQFLFVVAIVKHLQSYIHPTQHFLVSR